MMIKYKHILFASVIFLLLFHLCFAIETGEIKGKVIAETGEGLHWVEITLKSPSLQGVRKVYSLKNGNFYFPLLPVGTYTLSFNLNGFSPVVQKEVLVRLGTVTDLMVVMEISEIKEEITVSAPSPMIDKTSSDTSFHLGREELEKLPSANRTVVDAIKLTPGVTGVRINTRRGTAIEGQPSFRGEGEEGNNWIIDGISISGVRLRNSGMQLNFDSIDEIQVISDPFSPEFGPAYGGIINMVTKSGSNDISGEFSLLLTDKIFQAAHQDQLAIASQPDYFSNYNWYINLGGPLIKDKLWFFLSDNLFIDREETRDSTVDYFFIPSGEKSTRSNNLFTKLSYAITDMHNISATTILHKSLWQKGGTGIPELFEDKYFTDFIFRINYKGILNASTFIEAGFGQVRRDSLIEPLSKDLGPAQYYIKDLARSIHNSYGNVTDNQKRFDFNLKLTKYVETETIGHHEFNLGLEYYAFSSEFAVDFTGKSEDLFPENGFDSGTKYYFDTWKGGTGTPTLFYEYGDFNFINSAQGMGFFFKDKVSWGRVSMMIGIRSQTQLCLDNQNKKLWSWNLNDFLSPRFSLSVDLTGNGENILKFGWGRFSDVITTMPLGLFNTGAGLTFRTYRWQGQANPSEDAIHDTSNWRFENEQKLQPFEVAEGLSPNFLTRYLIGFDRKLGLNWYISARYVRSHAKDLLEVLAVFDPVTGYKFLYDNFELKRRDYKGIEFELTGKIGSRFFLNASYCFSSAKGTNPGQTETGSWSQEEGSTNFLGLFGNHIYIPDLPELKDYKDYVDWALGGLGGRGIGDEGWYGKLPYSVDHNIKINTFLLGPYGLAFSALFEWISGYYWEKLGYVPFFGGYYSFPEGRGSRKTPSHYYLDIGAEKEFKLQAFSFLKDISLILRFDIFNLFNSQKPISYVKEDIPIFGQVWGRQQPRQARMMIKVKW